LPRRADERFIRQRDIRQIARIEPPFDDAAVLKERQFRRRGSDEFREAVLHVGRFSKPALTPQASQTVQKPIVDAGQLHSQTVEQAPILAIGRNRPRESDQEHSASQGRSRVDEFRHRIARNVQAGRQNDARLVVQLLVFDFLCVPACNALEPFDDQLLIMLRQFGHTPDRARIRPVSNARAKVWDATQDNNDAWQLATNPNTRLRDPHRSVELAQKAVKLAPSVGVFWNTLGVASYRAGDWKAAELALRKSMNLRGGGDPFDWFFLAMAHWQLGAKDEARRRYDQAVDWADKNPGDDELRRFREEAHGLIGDGGRKPVEALRPKPMPKEGRPK
jgi:tetratricopeptide (TPR) repeat protein